MKFFFNVDIVSDEGGLFQIKRAFYSKDDHSLISVAERQRRPGVMLQAAEVFLLPLYAVELQLHVFSTIYSALKP